MKHIRDESGLLEQLSALPLEMTPRRDVWPQIATRIRQAGPGSSSGAGRRRYWPLAAAASIVMILTAGIALEHRWEAPRSAAPSVDAMTAGGVKPVPGSAYVSGSSSSGELEYQAALREFMALNTLPADSNDPKPEWMEQGWDTLRQVELELTAALRNEPDNDFLKSRLGALRARQIELLRQIAAVDSASWRNSI